MTQPNPRQDKALPGYDFCLPIDLYRLEDERLRLVPFETSNTLRAKW